MKETEPSFLTFAEKDQIKSLHESDPHEWTIEKLSESFPALPHMIKRVIHAKMPPKSVEMIVRYDERVAYNWEAFRSGELTVSPAFQKHLQNFKDRQIILTDGEELAKRFVPPKIKLPKPKSKFFSNIAQKFLLSSKEKKSISDDKKTDFKANKNANKNDNFEGKADFHNKEACFAANDNLKNKNIKFESDINIYSENRIFEDNIDVKGVQILTLQEPKQNTEIDLLKKESKITSLSTNLKERGRKENKNLLTFEEFLKKNVGRTENSKSPKDIVLKEIYKRHMEKTAILKSKPVESSTKEEEEFDETDFSTEESTVATKDWLLSQDSKSEISTRTKENQSHGLIQKTQSEQISEKEDHELAHKLNKGALETYVKEWHKKEDDEDIHPFIKIPQKKYKPGMTYRLKDCYYDDDGEFLYKVPGIRN